MKLAGKKLSAFMVLCFMTVMGMAQNPNNVEMADKMRSEGKIYVVVGVVLIILLGMFAYLIAMDRKLNKLQEELKK